MSDQETTENFWQVWNTFNWPEPKPVQFRLYYKPDGSPDFYTMDDLPGDYIEVDQQTYISNRFDVRVKDGKLIFIEPKVVVKKLSIADSGTPCDPRDICVVVSENQPHIKWKLVDHEIN